MADRDEMTPIIVGVGQVTSHWDGGDTDEAPSPISLTVEAAQRAIADTGASAAIGPKIGALAVVRTMEDSIARDDPRGKRCTNPPRTVAHGIGIDPKAAIHSNAGGDQPQALVSEFAQRLFEGEMNAALICGAEATAANKTAKKKGIKLDWSASVDGEMEDRGFGAWFMSEYEMQNGLGAPTLTYPIFENAIRRRFGMDQQAYRMLMSELWAGFSSVAANNPYAQFPVERSATFLATPSEDNFPISDPYLKWHVAQESVNQGAALLLTTVQTARDAGISEDKWIYLHGHAKAMDRVVSERPDLSRSEAIDLVLKKTLATSGKTAGDIDHIDIYSCFPCVVQIAAETLGVDWREKILTVTGGLPFFGGPGNNYSTHAIASMVELLRAHPDQTGLIMANGGFMSKIAACVYSAQPMAEWTPISSDDIQDQIDNGPRSTLFSGDTEGEIESYTVSHGRFGPERGYALVNAPQGRVLARVHTGHRATLRALSNGPDPIGRRVAIHSERDRNFITAPGQIGVDEANDGFLARRFEHVRPVRNGHILEVTLDRPHAHNALHSAAHYELGEIFDEFERDQDLWVAIITGAGEKAFCSGNDLKVTATGGDMSMPPSGFGGLCSRRNREKPIIAAVNGLAMGGGLEIVLACDMAIIDPAAKCALPEVRVGLFAAAGGVQRLSRQIGRKAANELIFTGRHFEADEALRLGVVNAIAETGQAMAEARTLAERILTVSPTAVRASKRVLNKLEELESAEEALRASVPVIQGLMKTNDFREGVTAFAEKRPPKWTNS